MRKIKILFVCHGNICRSPMSEFILKDIVEKRGIKENFEISSAATSTEEIWNGKGNPIYPPAQAELKKNGIGRTNYTDFTGKRARQVKKADYDYYDYLLCADTNNIRNTLRIVGEDKKNKIHLLMDFADENNWKGFGKEIKISNCSIADPWYTGNFETTFNDIIRGCYGFLEYINKQ